MSPTCQMRSTTKLKALTSAGLYKSTSYVFYNFLFYFVTKFNVTKRIALLWFNE